MGEVVPARTSLTLHPPSIVETSTVRVNSNSTLSLVEQQAHVHLLHFLIFHIVLLHFYVMNSIVTDALSCFQLNKDLGADTFRAMATQLRTIADDGTNTGTVPVCTTQHQYFLYSVQLLN